MDAPEIKVIATNRSARHNYELGDTYEAGLVLQGSEVKSLREAKAQLAEAFGAYRDGELWLLNCHIAPYSHSQSHNGHDPVRPRKMLLNRREIDRLTAKIDSDRLSIVPLKLYFKDGRVKVEIATGKGRSKGDKRQAMAKKEADRDARNEMGRTLKGY